jgi:hypothetical protein
MDSTARGHNTAFISDENERVKYMKVRHRGVEARERNIETIEKGIKGNRAIGVQGLARKRKLGCK